MLVSTIIKLLTSSLANSIDHNKSLNILVLKYFNFVLLFAGLVWISIASYWFLIDGLSINCVAALLSSLIFGAAIVVSMIYSKGLSRVQNNNEPFKILIDQANDVLDNFKNKLPALITTKNSAIYIVSAAIAGLLAYRVFVGSLKKFLSLKFF